MLRADPAAWGEIRFVGGLKGLLEEGQIAVIDRLNQEVDAVHLLDFASNHQRALDAEMGTGRFEADDEAGVSGYLAGCSAVSAAGSGTVQQAMCSPVKVSFVCVGETM